MAWMACPEEREKKVTLVEDVQAANQERKEKKAWEDYQERVGLLDQEEMMDHQVVRENLEKMEFLDCQEELVQLDLRDSLVLMAFKD